MDRIKNTALFSLYQCNKFRTNDFAKLDCHCYLQSVGAVQRSRNVEELGWVFLCEDTTSTTFVLCTTKMHSIFSSVRQSPYFVSDDKVDVKDKLLHLREHDLSSGGVGFRDFEIFYTTFVVLFIRACAKFDVCSSLGITQTRTKCIKITLLWPKSSAFMASCELGMAKKRSGVKNTIGLIFFKNIWRVKLKKCCLLAKAFWAM